MSEKIAFITPNAHTGKVPRHFSNMRTEFAWQCALNADHYQVYTAIQDLGFYQKSYNTIIFIPPKNWHKEIVQIVKDLRKACGFLWFMQEGPYNYWHKYNIEEQKQFLEALNLCDGILCHNKNDIGYYSGLVNNSKNVYNLPTLLIEDAIPEEFRYENANHSLKKFCLIGGTFTDWYGGHDSYLAALNSDLNLLCPTMGRINIDEQKINQQERKIQYLPYLNWSEWMKMLYQYPKVAVHLMPTFGAGTLALNCAYYGIPCIGYTYLDTQRILFPSASVELPNLSGAQEIFELLVKVNRLYEGVSQRARENYNMYYREEAWLQAEAVTSILNTAN